MFDYHFKFIQVQWKFLPFPYEMNDCAMDRSNIICNAFFSIVIWIKKNMVEITPIFFDINLIINNNHNINQTTYGIFFTDPAPSERGRTLSRISVAKGSNLNFRGRKSNSLMNLCGKTAPSHSVLHLYIFFSVSTL